MGLALALAVFAAYADYRFKRMVDTQLPKLTELPSGARAPTHAALGQELGVSTVADVQAFALHAGITCLDRSVATIVKNGVASEISRREAAGESGIWALRLYGWLNPHGRNPQVQLACEGVSSEALHDAERVPSHGRLLFVFDDANGPLRHVSFRRTIKDLQAAQSDWLKSALALSAAFAPDDPPTERPELPLLTPVEKSWNWTDVIASVQAINYGEPQGVVITETVEVPWPVRADATRR